MAVLGAFILSGSAASSPTHDVRPWCHNVVVPQGRPLLTHNVRSAAFIPQVQTTKVHASIEIVDGAATTVLAVDLHNPAGKQVEAELLLPISAGAKVGGFSFLGASATPAYKVLSTDEAREAYLSLATLTRDTAPLEFVGTSVLRSSVFPLAAGARQTVRIVLEEALHCEGGRVDYVLPRSEDLGGRTPWEVDVHVSSKGTIADVYSPTHGLSVSERFPHQRRISVMPGANGSIEAGSFRLSVLNGDGPLATTVFTARDPGGPGGWFMLLAGTGDVPSQVETPPREVTIVIDRSGSMAGPKFDQAIGAARQVLEGLQFGEAVQIIDYSGSVEHFAAAPVIKTKANLPALRAYLDSLTSNGGTDLDSALQAALAAPVMEGFIPVVLFLTDGLATNGEKREHMIRHRAIEGNVHGRRVFTFGVGNDVNAALLDAVAERSRARATYVAPGENVEVAVSDVFDDLSGPVMTNIEFEVADTEGVTDTRLVRDVYPGFMPDLFREDRLLLVGRYLEGRPAKLRLTGRGFKGPVNHEFEFDFAEVQPGNSFVPRLWAMRRIAALENSLRQQGADPAALAALGQDERFKETVAEMLDLAATHGVLTDSTAFLGKEETELGNRESLLASACSTSLRNNEFRSGLSSVAYQSNIQSNRAQSWVNSSNLLADGKGGAAPNYGVQTVQGRTYIKRGARWTDGRLALTEAATAKPDVEVIVGTPEYVRLFDEMTKAGRGAELSLGGEILIKIGGVVTLIKAAPPTAAAAKGVQH